MNAPKEMTADDRAKAMQSAQTLLQMLQGQEENARDREIVWIQNRHGIREPVEYGYWRKFMSKHQDEAGWRLLNPEEVQEEQDKIRQAAARRAESEFEEVQTALEALSYDALQARLAELEGQVMTKLEAKAGKR